MKPHSVFFASLVVFSLVSISACREWSSPTDPTPFQPPGSGTTTHSLSGQVVATDDRKPLAGVRIQAPGKLSTLSDREGAYRLTGLRSGFPLLILSKEGFLDTVQTVEISPLQAEARADFVLARNPGGLVQAYQLGGMTWVKGSVGRSAYVYAEVEILDGPQAGLKVMSDEMGSYGFWGLVGGAITVRASKGDASQTQTVTLEGNQSGWVILNFEF